MKIGKTKILLNIDDIREIKIGKEISLEDFKKSYNCKLKSNIVELTKALRKLEFNFSFDLLSFNISKIHSVKIVNSKVWCVVDVVINTK